MEILKSLDIQSAGLAKYLIAVALVLVSFGFGQQLITCAIGVAYPVLMSFRTLQLNSRELEKQWLTYWVVFGVFSIVDHFAEFVLSFVPFFYVVKFAFLICL